MWSRGFEKHEKENTRRCPGKSKVHEQQLARVLFSGDDLRFNKVSLPRSTAAIPIFFPAGYVSDWQKLLWVIS